ncbi:cytochrome b [Castellaniella caeni]|uniref:cytochrome b n=1 Tax=Castellaniella caeni TaxID=266123 RepID=UPI00082BDE4B|nr:cytochrome b [Castellaniella caeni]
MKSPGNRYHGLSIGLHWLTLVLLVMLYALIELRGLAPKGSVLREGMKTWHETLGLTVFCLVFARLVLRRLFDAPPITPAPPPWQDKAAHAMHWMLYTFLIIVPLLGWLTLSAKGKPVPFWGLDWPALLSPDKPLARTLQDVHETIGTLGYYLIGLHAAAALYHHYFLRDDTVRRMLPRCLSRPRQLRRAAGRPGLPGSPE